MRQIFWFVVCLLFIVPVILIGYKSFFLGISILPQEISDEWNVQVKIDTSLLNKKSEIKFPAPVSSNSQEISALNLIKWPKIESFIEEATVGRIITWRGDLSNATKELGYSFRTRISDRSNIFPKKIYLNHNFDKSSRYLSFENYSEDDMSALDELQSNILDPFATPIITIKKLYFYISEEIRLTNRNYTIPESITLGRASNFNIARIFNYLARKSQIPSRIGIAVKLEPDENKRPPKNQYRFIFFNEIHINGEWFPIHLKQRTLDSLPENFLILHKDIENLNSQFNSTTKAASIFAIPLRTNRYNNKIYADELKRSNSLFHTFSLYNLPISAQASIFIILLLPVGAVMISIFRNIVGLNTFGIFTPVLLTIFFIETEFVFALLFFFLVIFLGFFQRVLLDKLYLLAVPRISVLLTFVIIAYLFFILLNNAQASTNPGSAILSYFPVVIFTVLIERFSIDFIEEGAWNTLIKLLGTIIISTSCYFILTFKTLQQLMFTNPELLLWAIALNLIIGSYKGYRISEFFRFRDLKRALSKN